MTNFLATIGAIVVAGPALFGIAILGAMWRGWWLYPAWGWYLVPLGAPPISFWHFVALSILISTLTAHNTTKKDDRKEDWNIVAINSLSPILVWGLLWWMK